MELFDLEAESRRHFLESRLARLLHTLHLGVRRLGDADSRCKLGMQMIPIDQPA